jgi:ribosomal protein L32
MVDVYYNPVLKERVNMTETMCDLPKCMNCGRKLPLTNHICYECSMMKR